MNYIYTWADEEHTMIKRYCEELGEDWWIPVDKENRDYADMLFSNVVPEEYVAPPDLPERTAEEKLAASGLTVDELKGLLGL